MSHPAKDSASAHGIVAGVDGCARGWVVATLDLATRRPAVRSGIHRVDTFAEVLDVTADAAFVAVDIPIGLLDAAEPGGRICDREVRRLLGPRRSSVFSAPVRAVLDAPDYPRALHRQRASSEHAIGLSKQAFFLVPKIAEVDRALDPELQRRVREVHPELAFRQLAGGEPMAEAKRRPAGRAARARLLARHDFAAIVDDLAAMTGAGVAADDILDACANATAARRMVEGTAIRRPVDEPPRDRRGLRMEIWG